MRLLVFTFITCISGIVLLSAIIPQQKKYTLSRNHTFKINGTSNLHDWSEVIETVNGNAVIAINKDQSFNLETLTLKMDVYSIKSTRGDIMDNNTYKALKADKNPYIMYTLKQPVRAIRMGSGKKVILAKGQLTIAGVLKETNMTVSLIMLDSGRFTIDFLFNHPHNNLLQSFHISASTSYI